MMRLMLMDETDVEIPVDLNQDIENHLKVNNPLRFTGVEEFVLYSVRKQIELLDQRHHYR